MDQLSQDLASLKIDRTQRPPSSGFGWLLLLLVLAGLGVGGWVAYPHVAAAVVKTEVSLTEISLVSPAESAVELTATGYVVPQRTCKVSAKILGRIEKMLVKEGDAVKEDQVLYRMDDASQKANLSAARSRLLAAKARALSARAMLKQLEQQYEREKNLKEQGVLRSMDAEDRREQMRAQEELAVAAEAEAAATAEEVHAREVDLENTIVRAPMAGVVIGKPLDAGELVGTFNEKPAVELADFGSLLVEADVAEARMAKAKVGAPCEVVLDAWPGKRFRGQVVEIGSRVNRAKATVIVKVKVTDPVESLLPDMAARVSFLSTELDEQAIKQEPKLFAPKAAIAERGGSKVVFAVEDGKVRVVPVKIVGPFGAGFELASGPPSGTRVVANPPAELAEGHRVKEKAN